MKIKKICEYLSEIGILEIKDINYFLKIYSQIEQNKCKREIDRLKITLFSYLNSISKNDNLLFSICRNIIDSYLKTQLVLKYKSLNSLSNIFKNKFRILYNSFISKLNLFILKKKKNKFIVQPVYYRPNKLENNIDNNKNKSNSKAENINSKGKMQIQPKYDINDISNDPRDRLTADDIRECTFAPNINRYKPYKEKIEKVKSFTYYTPSFNILAKMPENKKKLNNNNNNYLNSFTDIERFYTYNDNNNNNNRYKKISSSTLDINNYKSRKKNGLNYDNNYNNNFNNYDNFLNNNYLIMVNKDYNDYNNNHRAKTPRQQPSSSSSTSLSNNEIFNNFLLKQNKHVKDVERKIINLKIEERKKEERECSFSPEIHTYNIHNLYNGYLDNLTNYYRNTKNLTYHNSLNRINNSNNNNNNGICRKFEGALSPKGDAFTKELYNISQNNSRKRINSVDQKFFNKLSNENTEKEKRVEDLRKKVMKEIYTFSPKIEYNDKYLVKDSFEERQNKYIDKKKKLENKKEEEEKMFIEEMNKMYMPKRKGKKDIDRLYNKEEIEKIREKKKQKNDEKQKKNVIDWNKRYKENKNAKKKSVLDIYEFNRKNKVLDNKKDKKENNSNEINKDNKKEKKEEKEEIQ